MRDIARRDIALNRLPGVVAGFTTRAGGNLAVSAGDREDVFENRARLLASVGFPPDSIAVAGQVHGNHVELVDSPGLVRETDALVTTRRGLLLGMVSADCAIVLVADSSGSVVGAAHAGWRGTVGGVVENLLDSMKKTSVRTSDAAQLDPPELYAYVSPCIQQERFEVGPEVAEQFEGRFVVRNAATGKAHVDLAGALVAKLVACGLKPDNVQNDGRCTFDDPDTFYSHRAQNGKTGRMMGFIGLR